MTWEYVAGFFDGEGSIGWLKNRNKPPHNQYPRIYLSQYYGRGRRLFELMRDWLEAQNIKCNKLLVVREKENRLVITGKSNVKAFLTSVLPYLHIKAEESAVMLGSL